MRYSYHGDFMIPTIVLIIVIVVIIVLVVVIAGKIPITHSSIIKRIFNVFLVFFPLKLKKFLPLQVPCWLCMPRKTRSGATAPPEKRTSTRTLPRERSLLFSTILMGDQVQTKKYQTLIIQNMTQDKKYCYKYESSTTANSEISPKFKVLQGPTIALQIYVGCTPFPFLGNLVYL